MEEGGCTICLESLANSRTVTLKCSHAFHDACLQKWEVESDLCPVCRTKTKDEDVDPPPLPFNWVPPLSFFLIAFLAVVQPNPGYPALVITSFFPLVAIAAGYEKFLRVVAETCFLISFLFAVLAVTDELYDKNLLIFGSGCIQNGLILCMVLESKLLVHRRRNRSEHRQDITIT